MDYAWQLGRLAATYLDRRLGPGDVISERRIASAERRMGLRLPEALRAYYRVAGRAVALNKAHNRMLSPEEKKRFIVFMESMFNWYRTAGVWR